MRHLTFLMIVLSSNAIVAQQEFRPIQAVPTPLPPVRVQTADMETFTFAAPLASSGYANSYGWYGPNFNAPLIDFLASDHIQKQIEFSSEQKKMLKEFRKDLTSAYADIAKKYPELRKKDLPRKERNEINRTVHLEYQEIKKKMSKELEEGLMPQQISLIKQAQFDQLVKMTGFSRALTNAPFKKDFDLSSKQKNDIEKIKRDTEKAILLKTKQMREEAKSKMLKVLNKKQKDVLKDLEGNSKKTPFIKL